MSPGLTAMTDRVAAWRAGSRRRRDCWRTSGSGKIRAAVGASDDLDRAAGRRGAGEDDRYPDTARRRGGARRALGHSVGKLCRRNYVA